jgi:hypothetical protein
MTRNMQSAPVSGNRTRMAWFVGCRMPVGALIDSRTRSNGLAISVFHTKPEAWAVFDVPYRDEPEQESGQILIDKRRCWRALFLCNWYNMHSNLFYKLIYGDKDSFRFAWHRTGSVYAMPPRIPWTEAAILQGDFQGNVVFQHRHGPKWSLFGNRRYPDFLHEQACFDFLADLAARWDPLAHRVRHLAADDFVEMSRIARRNYYFSLGGGRWPISLRPNGIVSGRGPYARYWWCESGDLFLSPLDNSPVLKLRRRPDGSWQGHLPEYGTATITRARTRIRRPIGRLAGAAAC